MLVTVEETQLNEMIERLQEYQRLQEVLIQGLCKIADTVDNTPKGDPILDRVKIIFCNTTRQYFKAVNNDSPSNH